ncbi:MAG: hypothetical protein LIP09_04895 [Bacteroidales bacterium]|nr:hypothetical protein [Bacteroidales bacterium]
MELYKTTKEEIKDSLAYLGKCLIGAVVVAAFAIGMLFFLWACYDLGCRM